MAPTRIVTRVSPLVLLVGSQLALRCASPRTNGAAGAHRVPAQSVGTASPAGDGKAAATSGRPRRTPRAYAERRPQLGITTPMKGEPSSAALSEARLVATTCEQTSSDEIEAHLKEMRAAP